MSDLAATPQAVPSPAAAVTQTGNGKTPPPGADLDARSPVRKIVFGVVLVLCVVGIALIIASFGAFRHWLALHTGTLHGGPDLYYNFWSGFGSDLGEATLISAVCLGVYTGVRKVNCHTKGCWRIGHHPLEGTPFILCKHHHPNVPNHGATHEEILAQHRRFKERSAAKTA